MSHRSTTNRELRAGLLLQGLWLGWLLLSACAPTRLTAVSTTVIPASTSLPVVDYLSSTAVPKTTISPPATVIPPDTATAPPTVRAIVPSPGVISLPYSSAVVQVELAEVWDEPAHERDNRFRQTQLILGEKVFILQTRAEWSQIAAVEQPSHKHASGYPGWVRTASLAPGWPQADLWLVVMIPSVEVQSQPEPTAPILMRAPFDVRLPVLGQTPGWVVARLPDGRSGWLLAAGLRLTRSLTEIAQSGELLVTARRLVGAPYLWGGTATGGWDCSGFIYRVFHAHGILLARDAQDQAGLGRPVDETNLQPGDLLFYAAQPGGPVSHVAVYTGEHMVLDASLSAGLTPHYVLEMNRARFFVQARRVLDDAAPDR